MYPSVRSFMRIVLSHYFVARLPWATSCPPTTLSRTMCSKKYCHAVTTSVILCGHIHFLPYHFTSVLVLHSSHFLQSFTTALYSLVARSTSSTARHHCLYMCYYYGSNADHISFFSSPSDIAQYCWSFLSTPYAVLRAQCFRTSSLTRWTVATVTSTRCTQEEYCPTTAVQLHQHVHFNVRSIRSLFCTAICFTKRCGVLWCTTQSTLTLHHSTNRVIQSTDSAL